MKVLATQPIKAGEAIVVSLDGLARPAFEGEDKGRSVATATEDIAKGEVMLIDQSTGLATVFTGSLVRGAIKRR